MCIQEIERRKATETYLSQRHPSYSEDKISKEDYVVLRRVQPRYKRTHNLRISYSEKFPCKSKDPTMFVVLSLVEHTHKTFLLHQVLQTSPSLGCLEIIYALSPVIILNKSWLFCFRTQRPHFYSSECQV